MKSIPSLLSNARDLRKHNTDVEFLLWQQLRSCRLDGVKFKRQQPLEGYIVDFVAFAPKLIIELDGSQHLDHRRYDEKRDACLRRNGFQVLRFWDNEVLENLEGVLEAIRRQCAVAASPSP